MLTPTSNPRLIIASLTNKAFSTSRHGDQQRRVQSGQHDHRQGSNLHRLTSVFGDSRTIEAVPSRQLSNDKIFLIDPDFVSLCTLNGRNFLEEDLAKVGDATESHVLIEWSLKPLAPKAHAGIFDLSGA